MHLTESSGSEKPRGTDSVGGGENDRTFQKMGEAIALENPSPVSGDSRKKSAGLWAQVQTCRRAPNGRDVGKALRAGPLRRLVGVSGNASGPAPLGKWPGTGDAEPELGFGSWQLRGLAPARPLSVSLATPPRAQPR